MPTPPPSAFHRLRRRLTLGAVLLGVVVFALAWALRGPAVVSPGDLSAAHAPMGDDCGLCHATPLRSARSVLGDDAAGAMNAACVDCHRFGVGVDRIYSEAHHGGGRLADTDCADCHIEHAGADELTAVAGARCVDCHASLESPVTGFVSQAAGGDHPDFSAEAGPSALRFDHERHVTAELQTCSACHEARAPGGGAGRGPTMSQPRFASQCADCHDLALVAGGVRLPVAHAPMAVLRARIAAAVADPAAAEGEDVAVGPAAFVAALEAPDGTCGTCHVLVSGPDGVAVAPVAAPPRAYADARFDHGAHAAIGWVAGERAFEGECAVCHASARTSADAEDLLLPGIATCTECHGQSAPDDCATCHDFHAEGRAPGHVQIDVSPEKLAKGERETRFGTRRGTPYWPKRALAALPAQVWGLPDISIGTPAYDDELFRRYGLFPADFDNGGLPLGLVEVDQQLDGEPHLAMTCEFCHSSVLFDRVVVGQPNRFSSMDALFRDMAQVTTIAAGDPLYEWNPRQNTVVNAADQLGLLGLIIHQDDLAVDAVQGARIKTRTAMSLKPEFDALAFVKTPPWYLFRTKLGGSAGYYFDGGHPKDGNFSAFTYLAGFHGLDGADVRAALSDWQDGGAAWLATLESPPWPFALDGAAVVRGRVVYDRDCADCHGHYDGAVATVGALRYPGRVIPQAEVGTDPLRANFPASFGVRMRTVLKDDYVLTGGYVATPLTGIWARAPYLHNGAVPSLRTLLQPETRPARWELVADPRRVEDYLVDDVGWRYRALEPGEGSDFNRVHDPGATAGLGNEGHVYGADLPPTEREDLMEFLRSL